MDAEIVDGITTRERKTGDGDSLGEQAGTPNFRDEAKASPGRGASPSRRTGRAAENM